MLHTDFVVPLASPYSEYQLSSPTADLSSHSPVPCSIPFSFTGFLPVDPIYFLHDAWMPEDSGSASTRQAFYSLAMCGVWKCLFH